ncbi:MAG: hypothetical protein QXI19_12425 [Candidatus Caldarchaeum sp.]
MAKKSKREEKSLIDIDKVLARQDRVRIALEKVRSAGKHLRKISRSDTPSDTLSDTLSDTPNDDYWGKRGLPEAIRKQFATLDSTHTNSEAKIYSIMYRHTHSRGVQEAYFSVRRLMALTGLNSPNTVRKGLAGLIEKRSIELLKFAGHSPDGSLYRVYKPKEIFEARERAGIQIDACTKKIIEAPKGVSEGVSLAVSQTVSPSVSEGVSKGVSESVSKIDTPTDTPGVSKIDTPQPPTPYIKNNNIYSTYISIRSLSSSISSSNIYGNGKNKVDDFDDDSEYSHKQHVIFLYEKYTGNPWKPQDDERYEAIKDVLPDVIEAAIITSVLRCKTRVNSLAYCEGAISEYMEFLPPGYVSYLREKWKELKESDS